jgi:TatD DNase family protein
MRLYDAHNHLQDHRLDAIRPAIFPELRARKVSRVVVNGTQESDWHDVVELAQREEMVIPSIGLHPWFVKERSPTWLETLSGHLDFHPCAIGEIGLDKWIEGYDSAAQEEAFISQLALASERQLPMAIHCLKAWGRLYVLLHEARLPKCGFLLHSYGGPREMISQFAQLGAYFSVSGYFMASRKRPKFEAFRDVPLDRLLIETDAPDMCLPEDVDEFGLINSQGRVNHPANLPRIYQGVAELLGISLDALAEKVEANFLCLFASVIKKTEKNFD